MSITNPITITNRLNALFELLGVVVTVRKPVTTKDDYGYNVVSEFDSFEMLGLPYNEQTQDLMLSNMGDLNTGHQYLAIPFDAPFVAKGDYVYFGDQDYLVEDVTKYSWGSTVMKALRLVVVETPVPPYPVEESGNSSS